MTAVSCSSVGSSASSPCISSLARCTTSGGNSPPTSAPSAFSRRAVGEQVGVDVRDVVAGGDAEADERGAAGRSGPARLERDARSPFRRAQQHRFGGVRVARGGDVDLEHLGLGRFGDLADRVEQPRQQGAELELVEQHPHLLAVELTLAELVDLDAAVDVEGEARHLAVLEHAVAALAEVRASASAAARRGARRSPSRSSYVVMSLAAVFSPMPGTPGRLSLVSPRSAA